MLELFDGIICCDDEIYGEGNDELYDSVMGNKIKVEVKVYKVGAIGNNKSLLESDMVIGLDTLAAVSIFKDNCCVIDKWKTDGILVSGVNKSGKNIFVNHKGISVLGLEVYVSKECAGNILSLGDARDNCYFGAIGVSSVFCRSCYTEVTW